MTAPPTAGEPAWQRLHPLTPWLRGWAAIAALVGFTLAQARDNLSELMEVGRAAGILPIVAIVVGVLLVVAIYNLVWWRLARFRIGADAVELSTGILARRHRSLRLDQLEAVDIVHPLVARLFGLAQLKLESAGGADSNLLLSYVTGKQAEAVRAEILGRRRTLAGPVSPASPASPAAEAPATPEADTPQLFRVPPNWTIRAYLRSATPWISLTATVVVGGVTLATGRWGGAVAVGGGLLVIIPFLLGFVQNLWKYIVTEMGFAGHLHPDGIRLTHGLLTKVSQTIPANRVQALRFRQRLWWRKPDWWRIDLNVAGYGQAEAQTRAVLAPVADPMMAVMAVRAIMPQAAADEVWSIVLEAMRGTGPSERFTCSPRRARLFAPLAWRRQGYARTDYALVLRSGRVTRTVVVVPHRRIQGISLDAGPWDRSRQLASVLLHSTQGPIGARLEHLDAGAVADLLRQEIPLITTTPLRSGL
jgi:putative membrane protein